MTRIPAALLGALIAAGPVLVTVSADAAPARPRVFANCDAMHRVYPHGVGRPGARDQTSGTPVTNFKRHRALYVANRGSDRDGDGIACESA